MNQLKAHCGSMRLQGQPSVLCPLQRDVDAVRYGSVVSPQHAADTLQCSLVRHGLLACEGCAAHWEGSVTNGLRGLTGSGLCSRGQGLEMTLPESNTVVKN